VSAGYFTAITCSHDLTLINTIDNVILYYLKTVTSPLINVVKLTGFVYPTIYF